MLGEECLPQSTCTTGALYKYSFSPGSVELEEEEMTIMKYYESKLNKLLECLQSITVEWQDQFNGLAEHLELFS